jgi:hypothetical protein
VMAGAGFPGERRFSLAQADKTLAGRQGKR